MTTPAQAAREREKARVSRLAGIADRCKGDRWVIDVDGSQTNIIAQRATGEHVVLCTIFSEALPDEIELICGALADTILFLELRRRAPPEGQRQNRLREGDFAANAAMLCAEPLFHRFLERRDQTRAIYNKDHADTVLKKLLGITSKKQLNTEERAQMDFIDLRTDFDVWAKRVSA